MKVSRFSRNKNRTNDRKDSTKQAKHLILNAVPQIRTKEKVMINIYIYIYILHVYMYITYILHTYKNTNTYIIYIYDLNFTFLLTLFSIFNVSRYLVQYTLNICHSWALVYIYMFDFTIVDEHSMFSIYLQKELT